MSKSVVVGKYDKATKVSQIAEILQRSDNKIHLKGLIGSSLSFVVNSLFHKSELPFLMIFEDKEVAAYFLNDLEQLMGDKEVLFIRPLIEIHTKLKKLIMPMFCFVLRF